MQPPSPGIGRERIPQRAAILDPGSRTPTPSVAPHVGDRQTPPKPVVQPARKTGGSAFGDDDHTLAGGAGYDQLGGGAPGKPGTAGHGKRPGGGGVAPTLPPPTNGPVVPGAMYKILGFDPDGPSEWGQAINTPNDAYLGLEASKAAIKATGLEYKGQPKVNNEADAFRHALWHYKMTRAIGAKAAKRFGDAHERSGSNKKGAILMDLYNNEVGRRLALDPKNSNRRDEDVILEAIRNGQLQIHPFNVPYSGLPQRPGSSSRW